MDIPEDTNVIVRRAEEVGHFLYWSTTCAYLKEVNTHGPKVTYAYYRKILWIAAIQR